MSTTERCRSRAGSVVLLVGRALKRHAIVNTGGIPLLGRLLSAIGDPATSADFLRLVLEASLITVMYAALGTAGALVIGVLGALVLSEATWRHPPGRIVRGVRFVLRGALVGARSIHELIWALLLVSVLGLDPLVAVLAIAIPFGAQTAKVFSEILDGVDRRPLQQLRSSGARSLPPMAYGCCHQPLPCPCPTPSTGSSARSARRSCSVLWASAAWCRSWS